MKRHQTSHQYTPSKFAPMSIASLTLLAVSSKLFAAQFAITNRASNLTDAGLDLVYKTAVLSLADTLETSINASLPSTSQTAFLDQTANGVPIASLGAHTNFGRSPKMFVVGVSGGVGLSAGIAGLSTLAPSATGLPASSLGVGGSVLVGLNLGAYKIIPSDRVSAFLNFGSYSTNISSITAGFTTFGLHAQYQLVRATGSPYLASFNGIQLGSGYQFSNNSLSYTTTFNFSQAADIGGADQVTMAWAPTFEFGLSTSTHTIPFEVSSSVSFLALFEIYGGLAMDLTFGSSAFTGRAVGDVTATAASGAGLSTNDIFSGTGTLDLSDNTSGSPTAVSIRYFGGGAISFFGLKTFGQIQSATTGATSILAGLKFVF